ncbi:MAG: CoA transferase [Roseofilum sp. SID2]|uniref:CaiB/BaiF CoA transferase family protein n=1 Tax=unclassified Roseofilum TaxID=2620099 RepID=UPI001B0438B5|nr:MULTISPECIES: CoA transferase [unclassified Roseofilum]MBP0015459.1 CoA transferase [Roseofilum sp. SID3]MBP0023223.1 CoA transferase [Roseofilum sp. SID2]MBP0039885.1 CoA transferase [Roseofilum sp. SID1]
MSQGALSALQVIDLTQYIAGPYCTKLLAGLGAEVIKVEPLSGDPVRYIGPFVGNQPGIERSIPFHWLNSAKKSVTLDLETPEGIEVLKQLIAGADVLVENFAPTVMSELGLSYERIREINPAIVMTSLSNFGQDGPYRDYRANEAILYAMSGCMESTGDTDKPPLAAGPAVSQYTASMYAYFGTLAAVFQRGDGGVGQHLDVSIQESAIENVQMRALAYLHTGKRKPRNSSNRDWAPWQCYPCRNGYAAVLGGPHRHWRKGASLFEEPRLLEERFLHVLDRAKAHDEVESLIQPWLMRHDKEEIFELGLARGFAFGYLATMAEAFEFKQHQEREFFRETESHPEVGRFKSCQAPFRLSNSSWYMGRSPLLGEHNQVIQAQEEQSSSTERNQVKENGQSLPNPKKNPPLSGIRVLEISREWAGPHAGRILADFGAEVIRIDYPCRMETTRGASTKNKAYNQQLGFHHLNRNKKCLAVDLKDSVDREILKDLIRQTDIVLENARPGVLKKLGFSYEDLKAIKPNIILVSMSAYGQTGTYAPYPGYGASIEPLSGVNCLTAYSPYADAKRIRETDMINGVMGACAALTALSNLQRTGDGDWADLSQLEGLTHAIGGEHFLEYAVNGETTLPIGNRHPAYAPHGCYRCREEDQWVAIAIGSDAEWRTFCEILGQPELIEDPRFATSSDRQDNHDALDRLIEAWTCEKTHYEVMHLLQKQGLMAGAVLNMAELCQDPHLWERNYFQKPSTGSDAFFPGFPLRMSVTSPVFERIGADLGEHDREIICHLLGRPEEQVKSWQEEELGTDYDP